MKAKRFSVDRTLLSFAIALAASMTHPAWAVTLTPGQSGLVNPGTPVTPWNLTGATLTVNPGGTTLDILGSSGSTVTLNGAVVNAPATPPQLGLLQLQTGSTATVTGSTITTTVQPAVTINDTFTPTQPSSITVTNSAINGFGRGINLSGGSGSSVTLIDSQLTGTGTGPGGITGDGVGLSMTGGTAILQGSAVTGSNRGVVMASATSVLNTPTLTVDHSTITGSAGSAILVGTGNTALTNATILVEDGSTLTGANGVMLEVGQTTTTATPTTVNFTADNSALIGDVQVVSGSTANITLRNNASVTGNMTNITSLNMDSSIMTGDITVQSGSASSVTMANSSTLTGTISNVQTMGIDSTSRWNMVNDSNVGSLALNGGTVNLRGANSGFHTLTLGSLSGAGTFAMGTDLAAHESDLINVTGNATGSHVLEVENTGLEPPAEDHAQQVVHTGGGDAAFAVAGGVVDAGTFAYSLEQRGTDWFLVQARDDNGDPIITPGAQTVIDVFSAAPTVWYGELATLRVRMGELRNGHDQGGVWARTYGNKFNVSASDGANYQQTQSGISFGADTPLPSADGQWLVGVLGGYSYSDLNIARGSTGAVNSYYLGLYSTWLSTTGYYVDAVIKANRFHNKADAVMDDGVATRGDYRNYGIGASVEGGKHIELADNWFVEPYAQMSTLWVEGKDYQLDNGLDANSNHADSYLGKIGTHVGRTYPLDKGGFVQPYVKVAVAHEFANTNRVNVNDTSFNNDLSGTRGELGTGVAAQLSSVMQVHADLDYSNGNHIEQPWGVNLGLRYTW